MSKMARLTGAFNRASAFNWITATLFIAGLLLLPALVSADSASTAFDSSPEVGLQEAGPACARIAEAMNATPAFVFSAAEIGAQDELEALAAWNREVGQPVKNGFSRPLAVPRHVTLADHAAGPAVSSVQESGRAVFEQQGEDFVWGTRVQVDGAYRLRLHLSAVRLPDTTIMWVYGNDGDEPIRFGMDLVYDGSVWTPSVAGDTLFFELRIPVADAVAETGFTVDSVLEMFELNAVGEPLAVSAAPEGEECFRDAACYGDSTWSWMSVVKKAIGQMYYVKSGSGYVCTGGLMNDLDDSGFIPYFLTANHCISSQAVASTLEVTWDKINTSCNGSLPAYMPKTYGATLLATQATNDATFLQLNTKPSGRAYLGWTSYPFGGGIHVYRLSHPHGGAMSYSVTYSNAAPSLTCTGLTTGNFIYSDLAFGGTTGGSSGSPAMNSESKIVGQLYGKCGPTATISNACAPENYTVDGRFSEFYPLIRQWLNPSTPPGPTAPCVATSTAMCLNYGRFKVEVFWRDYKGNTGSGVAVPYGSNDSGLFWFFSSSNWEMLIKVLNGCTVNGRYWVFFAATTDQEFTVTVTDTATGYVKQYFNPLGFPADAVTDTSAFATCP